MRSDGGGSNPLAINFEVDFALRVPSLRATAV